MEHIATTIQLLIQEYATQQKARMTPCLLDTGTACVGYPDMSMLVYGERRDDTPVPTD